MSIFELNQTIFSIWYNNKIVSWEMQIKLFKTNFICLERRTTGVLCWHNVEVFRNDIDLYCIYSNPIILWNKYPEPLVDHLLIFDMQWNPGDEIYNETESCVAAAVTFCERVAEMSHYCCCSYLATIIAK